MVKTSPYPVREEDLQITAIRAQGAGGQNVNKVSNAVHLRYDVHGAALPDAVKERLLALPDQRITAEGVVVIKAQGSRSLEHNRADAIARLQALIDSVSRAPRVRRATRPTLGSQRERLQTKAAQGALKRQRSRISALD